MLRKLSFLALASAAACTLLNPLDEFDRGSERDAGGDVATPPVEASAGDGACQPHRWPAPPASNGSEGEGNIDFLDALRTLQLGVNENDAGPRTVPSYDLDGVCSCPGAGSCTPYGSARVACDDDGGADNAGGQLAVQLSALAGADPDVTDRITSGEYGLLLKVTSYNGGPDDMQVALSVFLSNGTIGSELEGGTPSIPKFDGTDQWTIDPTSVGGTPGGDPPYAPQLGLTDLNAYVSGGILVANVSFAVRIGPLVMDLTGGRITGRIVKDALGYHIEDGLFVGRWPAAKALTSLAAVRDRVRESQVPNAGLCGDAGLYPGLKTQICNALDLAALPSEDNTGAACAAAAISLRFRSAPALFGPLFAMPARPLRDCPPNWTDDCAK